MAFRPEWYQDDDRGGPFRGVRNWSGMRLLLTLEFGIFGLQLLAWALAGKPPVEPLAQWLGLRAWLVADGGEGLVFNPFFPLQLVSYMFVHSLALGHVGWNMLYLWFFGRALEATLGKAGFLRLFLVGGVVGGLAQWGLNLTQLDPVPVVGASGAVYAVMALFALRFPREKIIIFPILIPIPIIFVAGFKVASDLMGFMRGDPGVAWLAHLGGAAVGLIWHLRGDMLLRAQQGIKRVQTARADSAQQEDRREMDRILRKIQSEGLASLSETERAFLDRRSRELRQRGS